MKTLKFPDMHCAMCVKRIGKALTEAKIEHKINLDEKKVEVDEKKVAAAMEALYDLGFTAEE